MTNGCLYANVAEAQLGKQGILEFRTLHVGGYLHAGEDIPHFVGQLQQIWFNGYPYLEIARSAGSHQTSHQGVAPIIRVTGKFGKRNHPVHHPVTFTSKHTFVGLPVLKAYLETNIYFQVKIDIFLVSWILYNELSIKNRDRTILSRPFYHKDFINCKKNIIQSAEREKEGELIALHL